MPTGGTLSIHVSLEDDAESLLIVFADQGTGMDQRQRESYFQPFNSSFDEGTGLGAAIVYRLIEEHGGKIRLESKAGKGTRVLLSLPRYCGHPRVQEHAEQYPLHAAGGRCR